MYKCLHSHISIAGIAAETFANLKELTTLRLDNNLLSSFPVWELAANPALAGLSLANNLWSCKCDFLNHFLVFQKKIGAKIQDKAEIRCVTDHYLGEAVTPLDNVICADQPANSGKEEKSLSYENFHLQQFFSDFKSVSPVSPLDYTPILVSVLVAVVLIVVGELYSAVL